MPELREAEAGGEAPRLFPAVPRFWPRPLELEVVVGLADSPMRQREQPTLLLPVALREEREQIVGPQMMVGVVVGEGEVIPWVEPAEP